MIECCASMVDLRNVTLGCAWFGVKPTGNQETVHTIARATRHPRGYPDAMRWLLALGVMLASPRPTRACTCVQSGMFSPSHQSTGVARNAVLFTSHVWGSQVIPALVRVSDGMQVPITIMGQGYWAGYVLARPDAVLDANTTYRFDVPNLNQTVTSSTFTTGNSTDSTAPGFAGLSALTAETMTYPIVQGDTECYSSCVKANDGRVSRLRLDYSDLPPDAAFAILDVYHEPDHVLAQSVSMDQVASHVVGFLECAATSAPLELDGNYCAHITAYDVAGNAAGGGVMACTKVTSCQPILGQEMCTPEDGCTPIAPMGADGAADEPKSSSGCAAAPGGGVLLLGLLALRRKRR